MAIWTHFLMHIDLGKDCDCHDYKSNNFSAVCVCVCVGGGGGGGRVVKIINCSSIFNTMPTDPAQSEFQHSCGIGARTSCWLSVVEYTTNSFPVLQCPGGPASSLICSPSTVSAGECIIPPLYFSVLSYFLGTSSLIIELSVRRRIYFSLIRRLTEPRAHIRHVSTRVCQCSLLSSAGWSCCPGT